MCECKLNIIEILKAFFVIKKLVFFYNPHFYKQNIENFAHNFVKAHIEIY